MLKAKIRSKKNPRYLNIWLIVFLSLVFALPCRGQTQTEEEKQTVLDIEYSRYGGTLTVAVPSVTSLDSQLARDFSSRLIIHNIQEGLFDVNQNQELVPVLASAPPQMEDEVSYLLFLRKGVYFHDGSELEAHSVVFTVERLLNPDTKAPLHAYFAAWIKSAEVVDKYTVRVKLAKPYIDVGVLFSRIELYPLSAKAVTKYGKDYGKVAIVGTGPFSLYEWVRNERIILRRFAKYREAQFSPQEKTVSEEEPEAEKEAAGTEEVKEPETKAASFTTPLPYLNILQFRFHASQDMALIDLQTRRLSALGGIDAIIAKQVNSRHIKVVSQPGLLLEQIYLNVKQAPFDNKLVRMALAYGLDRRAFADKIFNGYATVANSCFPSWHWAHDPEYKGIGNHPQISTQLLKQAGYSESNPLKFELLCTDEPLFVRQAQFVAKQWGELGVQVTVSALKKEEVMGRLYGRQGYSRDFSAVLEDWQGGMSPESFSYDLYSKDSEYNKVLYDNPMLELLFYDARSSHTKEEKTIFYHQIERQITGDISTIYLTFPHNIWAYNRYVNGMQMDYQGLVSFKYVWIPR